MRSHALPYAFCLVLIGAALLYAGHDRPFSEMPSPGTSATGIVDQLRSVFDAQWYFEPGIFTPAYILWENSYNHHGASQDASTGIAASPGGDIWVTGMVENPGTGFDFYTIIYDPDGNVLNELSYDGGSHGDDIPHDLIVDDGGNCYIVGQTWDSGSLEDIVLVKYDPTGTFLWDSFIDGNSHEEDIPNEIALDASGRIGVTGTSNSGLLGGLFDYITIIWDSSGTVLCEDIFNGPFYLNDAGRSIAFDSEGNCLVTGNSLQGFTQFDIVTIKYDTDCNRVWTEVFNGPIDEGDYASKVRIDSQDNVIIAGYSRSGTSHRDYLTLKYDPDGDLIWQIRYDGTGFNEDYSADMVVDDSDNIYVTGKSRGSNQDYDIATVKYSPDGTEEWVRRYSGLGKHDDEGIAITLDGSGNVYVTGTSYDQYERATDIVTIKYDSEGTPLWVRNTDGDGRGDDIPGGLIIDDIEGLYLTGSVYNGTETASDYLTVKMSP